MRTKWWGSLMLLLAAVMPAVAQNIFNVANPRPITPKSFDMTKFATPPLNVQAYNRPASPTLMSYNLTSFLPRLNFSSGFAPKHSTSVLLTGKSNIYQPNPPVGINPFDPPKKK